MDKVTVRVAVQLILDELGVPYEEASKGVYVADDRPGLLGQWDKINAINAKQEVRGRLVLPDHIKA